MEPYSKRTVRSTPWGDAGWEIRDGDDLPIAVVDTERMADCLLYALLNPGLIPELKYPVETSLHPHDDRVPWYCQNCGHRGAEEDFWPSDGNPSPHVCPRCGSTNTFLDDQEER